MQAKASKMPSGTARAGQKLTLKEVRFVVYWQQSILMELIQFRIQRRHSLNHADKPSKPAAPTCW
jgi:hypothetical protein